MNVENTEFLSLLERARAGDQDALHEIAKTYERELRIVAHRILGPALRPYLDTVDLVQSVHRSLMIGLKQKNFEIANPNKLVGLALVMVRRKVARHWRRLKRQQRPTSRDVDSDELAGVLSALSSRETDPVRAVELDDAVSTLCKTLKPEDQQLILLRLGGHSTVEVAKQMEMDADVLRVRLSRLRKKLRQTGVLAEWL